MTLRVLYALSGLTFLATLGCKGPPQTQVATGEAPDPRTAVALPAEGQQAVLKEMRQMLAAIGGALDAAAKNDTAAIHAALAPAGSAAAADPALEALLPSAWKELAERTHGSFDNLSAAVRQARGGPAVKDTVMVGLARVSGACTSCHETFRVTVR